MNHLSNIHVGTSGWSYKHWRTVFYPPDVKPAQYLTYLSKEFGSTEINTSFYRLPSGETIHSWMRSVPTDFKFCPKMSRYLTQMKKLNDPEEPLERFFHLFSPMKKMLGPTLLQLPPNLSFNLGKSTHLFEILRNSYQTWKIALEVRHSSWLEPAATRLLKYYGISLVIADSGGRFPMASTITAKDVYLRFHGPDGSYATSYPPAILKEYVRKCVAWSENGHRLWVFFNNDLHGYAIANARSFQQLLASRF